MQARNFNFNREKMSDEKSALLELLEFRKLWARRDISGLRLLKDKYYNTSTSTSVYRALQNAATKVVDEDFTWTLHASCDKIVETIDLAKLFQVRKTLSHINSIFSARCCCEIVSSVDVVRLQISLLQETILKEYVIDALEEYDLSTEQESQKSEKVGEVSAALSSSSELFTGREVSEIAALIEVAEGREKITIDKLLRNLLSYDCDDSIFLEPKIIEQLLRRPFTTADCISGVSPRSGVGGNLLHLIATGLHKREEGKRQEYCYLQYYLVLEPLLAYYHRNHNNVSTLSALQHFFRSALWYCTGRYVFWETCSAEYLEKLGTLFVKYGASVEELSSSNRNLFLEMVVYCSLHHYPSKPIMADNSTTINSISTSVHPSDYKYNIPHFRWMLEHDIKPRLPLYYAKYFPTCVVDSDGSVPARLVAPFIISLLIEYGIPFVAATTTGVTATNPQEVQEASAIVQGLENYGKRRARIADLMTATCGNILVANVDLASTDNSSNSYIGCTSSISSTYSCRAGLLPPLIQLSVNYLL